MRSIAAAARALLLMLSTIGGTMAAPAAPGAPVAAAEPPVRVESFSPTGSASDVRQVAARFTAPMVALGDPRLGDPFIVNCPEPGKGHWIDQRNWVYDFDADLEAGVRCRFALRPGLRSIDGAAVAGESNFYFDTGGPAIKASLPADGWQDLDEDQVFLLRLSAVATQPSIEAHAWCAIDGVQERVPLVVLAGAERQAVLDQREALGYDYLTLLWKDGERTDARVRNRQMETRDALIVVARCQRHLPPGARLQLHWGAGIAARSGLTTRTDQQLAFQVRNAFTAQVECSRINPRAGCLPIQPIEVNFTAQVPRAAALGIRLRTPDGKLLAPVSKDDDKSPVLMGVSFAGPFPESSELQVLIPAGLADDAGRTLENAARFPLAVRVDAFPPLVRFSGNFGILESRQGGVLPVTLRNVEARLPALRSDLAARLMRMEADPKRIADWIDRVEAASRESGEFRDADPAEPAGASLKPKLEDAAGDEEDRAESATHRAWYNTTGVHSVFGAADAPSSFDIAKPAGPRAEEVIGIPLRQPGFYVVEIASRVLGAALLGRDETRYVATAALVTDLAVHFKWGRESSLVWVTRLSDGRPVAAADVGITDICSGRQLWQGQTDVQGVASVNSSLGAPPQFGFQSAACGEHAVLMAVARKGDDFSFTESRWDQGIRPTDFGLPTGSEPASHLYHTVLDRALFRAGETVSMKHYLRRHISGGLAIPEGSTGHHRILIMHAGSGQEYPLAVKFGADGTAVSEWKIPPEARLGDYSVSIDGHPGASFKVEEFRLPTMHASISGPARPVVAAKQVDIDVHVDYLSGGGASGLPVKVRSLVEPEAVRYSDYDDYEFGGAAVKEGIETEGDAPAQENARTRTVPLTLDGNGGARVTLDQLPPIDGPSRLTAELEYADPNGEMLTASGFVRLRQSSLSVGIRPESWAGAPGQLRFRVVVLDIDGKPSAGQAVSVALYRSSAYSYRKRLLGGFYSYETIRETRRLQPGCSGVTSPQGLLLCELAPGVSGQVLVRAETRDGQGRIAGATASMWTLGEDDWWFGGTSGDRMDVLPEKKEYQPGETARLQVRMPFHEATALVTLEREGVLSSFVTSLKGNAPIIEVPVTPGYSPNVFVSVLAVRGRIAHAEGGSRKSAEEVTALVDLTRPAYRLGTAQIRVGWRPHRLDVQLQADKAVYRVREKANVRIHVATADGQAPPPGSEVAVAAVDEALLDLAPNDSWDVLTSMMAPRGLEVWTSTAQMQVVGKRHYGRKAVPHGGGGGRELDRARELFDSLLLWRARVALDEHGEAVVSVPLNDSLSSFRIVAVAQGDAQQFGTGTTRIGTSQDLILTSGLPPLVREGDHYLALFTVRNASDHALHARIQASSPRLGDLEARDEDIPAGQSRDVTWSVTAPSGVPRIDWDVTARDAEGVLQDRLKVSESSAPVFPVRTWQATIAQLTAPLTVPLHPPAGAVEGRGGIEISLAGQLAGNLEGVREYMQAYHYTCLEQLASKAVALRSRAQWDALMQRLPAYVDRDGLARYFATDRLQGDDSLTAYLLSLASEAGWPLDEIQQARMIEALTRFVQGKLHRNSALPTADLSIRKLQAIAALARYGASEASMLDSIPLDPRLLPTSALLDLSDVLGRTSGIARSEERQREALDLLRARLNLQGTTMGFSTERSDALWWLMISADSNANRLLLATMNRPEWRDDLPRLVRGALGRQQSGHWNTTVANAWGVLALEKFSATFESVPVTGSTALRYGAEKREITWPRVASGAPDALLAWQTQGPLEISQHGTGAPWVLVRATAALPLRQPLSSGFRITRSVAPVEQQQPGAWTRGDIARVHLELEAQSDMSWVVVEDPVPAGASILGNGLGGQSDLVRRDERSDGVAWLAFEERRFEGYRAYYRFVPKGRWSIDYTVRLNNPGTFTLPATHVEAMYAPEMLGDLPNTALTVLPPGAHP